MLPLDSNVLDLLAEITRFSNRHGMSESRFGREAVNDIHFVKELREGRDVRISTLNRVRAFMRAYQAAA